ncbi:MAG: S49 family peptidase [Candidatus Bathyarchaeia archaeon]
MAKKTELKQLASLSPKRLKALPIKSLAIALIVIIVISGVSYVAIFSVSGKIALIDVYYPMVSIEIREYLLKLVNYAIESNEIKAVVLRIDSEGGIASDVEEIYKNLLVLHEKKPIVASIVGLGVSGSYHLAIASDYIYAELTAFVGNVGVVGRVPEKFSPSEEIIETGPYKRVGFSQREFQFLVDSAFESFIDSVLTKRGDKLKISREELSKGLIYTGLEASKLGLVDEVGSSADAIKKASSLAGLIGYKVVNVNELFEEPYLPLFIKSDISKRLDKINPPPTIYYMYIPYSIDSSKEFSIVTPRKASQNGANNSFLNEPYNEELVLIDLVHGNAFSFDELDIILSEIVSRGFGVEFLSERESFQEKLMDAKSLIIINPTEPFYENEVKAIEGFIGSGNKLLLIAELTRESIVGANSIGIPLGLIFMSGYLYNLKENYGNYRNIIVTNFNNPISKDVKKAVFYTSTYIHTIGKPLAVTSDYTVYSGSEKTGEYAIISIKDRVLAVADFTFMTEPYCYEEDNYKLLENIIDYLVG